MRSRLVLVPAVLLASLTQLGSAAFAQNAPLAPRGVGLIPAPPQAPTSLAGAPPAHPFIASPSGEFSRVIFQTSEGPNFNIVIRDYFFPPSPQMYRVTLAKGGLLHLLSGQGDVRIANEPMPAKTSTRTIVPLAAPLTVTNRGEVPVVVRVLTLEPK